MLQLNTSWKHLYQHIISIEAREKPRRPDGSSLIVNVEQTNFNSSIPILTEKQLNKWLSQSKWRSPSRKDSPESASLAPEPVAGTSKQAPEPVASTSKQASEPVAGASKTHKLKKPKHVEPPRSEEKITPLRIKKRPRREPPKIVETPEPSPSDDEVQIIEQEHQTTAIAEDRSQSSCSEGSDYQRTETICQGEVDGLAIKEDYDEYSQYDDDDDDQLIETEFTRNMKKIKPDIPTKPSVKIANPLNRPTTAAVKPSNPKPVQLPSPPKVPEPIEPNWAQTAELIKNNQLRIAYRDLRHFKARIKSDRVAETLPIELIKKCFAEDDTDILINTLELLFELDFDNKIELWSELVGRFKRKLNPHVQVRKFRSKMDPDLVFSRYKTAMVNLTKYASQHNLTVKLCFDELKFFVDPIGAITLKRDSPVKTSTPTKATANNNAPGPSSIGLVKPDSTKQAKKSTCGQENSTQEQVNGVTKVTKERVVTPLTKRAIGGNPVLRVSRIKNIEIGRPAFSKRL